MCNTFSDYDDHLNSSLTTNVAIYYARSLTRIRTTLHVAFAHQDFQYSIHVDLIWAQRIIRFLAKPLWNQTRLLMTNIEYLSRCITFTRDLFRHEEVSLGTRFPKVERSSLPRNPDETSVRGSAISSSELHLPLYFTVLFRRRMNYRYVYYIYLATSIMF